MHQPRQCYTCVSQKQRNPNYTPQKAPPQQSTRQILLNTSSVMKGKKKRIHQHLKTQILRGAISNRAKTGKNKSSRILSNSTYQSIDHTPRGYQNDQNQFQITNEFQIQDFLHQKNTNIQKNPGQKLKIFNTILKQRFNKIICPKKHFRPHPTTDIKEAQYPEQTLRETIFSKQLKRSSRQTPSNMRLSNSPLFKSSRSKMVTQNLNISALSTKYRDYATIDDQNPKTVFQSVNLNSRLNQYMNVIVKKTHINQYELRKHINKTQQQTNKQKNQQLQRYLIHDQLHNIFRNKKGIYFKRSKSRRLIKERNEQKSKQIQSHSQIIMGQSRMMGKKVDGMLSQLLKSSDNKTITFGQKYMRSIRVK